MSGSEQSDIRWDELIDFAAGEASEETAARVRAAMTDPNHPLAYLLVRSTRHPLQSAKGESESSATDIDSTSIDEVVSESIRSEIAEYLEWEQEQLEHALIADLPDDLRTESELVYRSGSVVAWKVLEPYLPRLRKALRDEWRWPERHTAGEFQSELAVAAGLAEFLHGCAYEFPFAPAKLAAALVRIGLDRLCR